MPVQYALLKGKVIGGMRAEEVEQQVNQLHITNGTYRSNHFHILVEAAGQKWRCPVNVRSEDGSEVWFKIRDVLRDHSILDGLPSLTEGLHELPQRKPGLTLDFIREPIFDRFTMRHLPKDLAGADNDVQDQLELYVNQAQNDPGAVVYLFGSFWRNQQFPPDKVLGTTQGVHDIHMNQGNDSRHRGDDGVYQDGGVIFYYQQTDRYVGSFLAFNSQVWFTNNQNGHRLPGFAEGPLVQGTVTPEPEPGQPTVGITPIHIIAAFVNPEGDDVGKETVTLFNASTTPIHLDGWKLVDRQNKTENLAGLTIEGNAAVTIRLSGQGVQLGNHGGAIRLIDPKEQFVAGVTYTEEQAVSGRILVF